MEKIKKQKKVVSFGNCCGRCGYGQLIYVNNIKFQWIKSKNGKKMVSQMQPAVYSNNLTLSNIGSWEVQLKMAKQDI